MIRRCLLLVWRASPKACALAGLLQVAAGVGVAIEFLAAKRLLSHLLNANRGVGVELASIIPSLAVLLATATLVSFATVFQNDQQRIMSELVSRHVTDRLLDVTVSVDLQSYEAPAFFDRLQRAGISAQSRPWQMTMGLLTLMSTGLTAAGIAVAVLAIQPVLLPLVVASSLPFWLATLRNSRDAHKFAYEMTPGDRERNYLGGILTGRTYAKEVRLFGIASFVRQMYDVLYDQRLARFRDLMRCRLRRSITATACTAALTGLALTVLVSLVLSGRSDLAGAITAALAMQQLGLRLRTMYGSVGSLYEGALFLEDFEAFLQLRVRQDDDTGVTVPPRGFSRLVLENVSFSYPGTSKNALSNLSMEILAGEIVALVGENGSGKTTLAKLLCHLYRPTMGRILWDGVDTANCKPSELRRFVTGIFQDFSQYHLRARDNIAVGDHERFRDLEAIIRAARQAGAHDFLVDLPQGYETRLGRQFEGGHELSVGQWQRVALARAFFRAAPFIVLDEPTAALDARAEHELFEAVRELLGGRTVLLISHRFSSVKSADRILVMQAGRLVEHGTHTDLLRRQGLYADLFTLQASSYLGTD